VRPYVQPYAEVNVGMLYNDLKNFSLGSRLLFSVNGAVGVQSRSATFRGDNRHQRHISNAGRTGSGPQRQHHRDGLPSRSR
jgi:hypothetical protein